MPYFAGNDGIWKGGEARVPVVVVGVGLEGAGGEGDGRVVAGFA